MKTREEINQQDFPSEGPHAWVQHKGTELCADFHCACGTLGHIDGDFVYKAKCKDCGRVYAVGGVLKLIELTPEEAKLIPHEAWEFSNDE